jgi:hypothetical protein
MGYTGECPSKRSRYRAGYYFSNGFRKENFIAADQRVTQFE